MGGTEKSVKKDWGLGGLLLAEDQSDGKTVGTMIWGGLPNLNWVSLFVYFLDSRLIWDSGSIARPVFAACMQDRCCPLETPRLQRWVAASRLVSMRSTNRLVLASRYRMFGQITRINRIPLSFRLLHPVAMSLASQHLTALDLLYGLALLQLISAPRAER